MTAMTTPRAGIELRRVSKRFGAVTALREVGVTLEENRIYGLLGRNGAGKSTLLNILTGRDFADTGVCLLDGKAVGGDDRQLRRLYLAGEQNLFPEDMTVRQALRWEGEFFPSFDRDYAQALCETFQLNTKKKIKGLSTGYRSIFQNISALAANPDYLLLDEPVLGLDANHRTLFYRTLIEHYSLHPCTIVISTHLIEEAAGLIEEVIILKEGSVLLQEPRETLLERGYTVSGPAAAVDRYLAESGQQCIGVEQLGGLKSACLLGALDRLSLPAGLEASRLDLQQLFIQLTNS